MNNSFIDLVQEKSETDLDNPARIEYRIVITAVRGIGIPKEVFVHETATSKFINVATIHDLHTWPIGIQEALNTEKDFYRTDNVNVVFLDPTEANDAAIDHQRRIRLLIVEWDRVNPKPFSSQEFITIDGEAPPDE